MRGYDEDDDDKKLLSPWSSLPVIVNIINLYNQPSMCVAFRKADGSLNHKKSFIFKENEYEKRINLKKSSRRMGPGST